MVIKPGIPAPLLNPLMQQLAIRLGRFKTAAKSLVIPLGEGAIEKGNFQSRR